MIHPQPSFDSIISFIYLHNTYYLDCPQCQTKNFLSLLIHFVLSTEIGEEITPTSNLNTP